MSRSRTSSLPTALVSFVIVLAITYLALPFLKESPLPFVLINGLALTFFALALIAYVLVLCPTSSEAGEGEDVDGERLPVLNRWQGDLDLSCSGTAADDARDGCERALLNGLLAIGLATFVSALIMALLLGPLFGKIPFQDQFYILIPVLLNLSVYVSAVMLGGPLVHAMFPSGLGGGTADAEAAGAPARGRRARCEEVAACYGLTARELQVLVLVADGRNEPYICNRLGISKPTVKTHVNHIYKKVGVSSRQELLDLILEETNMRGMPQ